MIALIQRVLRAEVRVLDGVDPRVSPQTAASTATAPSHDPAADPAAARAQERLVGAIGPGLLAFICAERGDTPAAADKLLAKVLGYRVFGDAQGKMNLGLQNLDGNGRHGGLLLVSQFTLAADTRSGMRPSFTPAAPPDEGRRLFDYFVTRAQALHTQVATGEFGAEMQVSLVNDGPVTFWLEARPA